MSDPDFLITAIFHPSFTYRMTRKALCPIYRFAERIAGYDDDQPWEDVNVSAWPRRARALYWLGDRVDDLGIWANRRKAARREP